MLTWTRARDVKAMPSSGRTRFVGAFPDSRPWVKYFSFAFTGGPIGLALLTAGVVFADAGIAVPGAVFVCLALCSLIVGIRIRRRRAAPR